MKYIFVLIFLFSIFQMNAEDISDAIMYYNDGNYEKAEECLLKMNETAKVLNALGRVSYIQGDIKESINYYKRALENCSDTMETVIRLNLGNSLSDIGYLDYAIQEYEKSMVIAKRTGKESTYVNCLLNMGVCYSDKGDDSLALNLYYEALSLTSDKQIRSTLYNNIAVIYEVIYQDFNKALELYLKSLDICKENEINDKTAIAYSNVGSCYLIQDSLDKARLYLDSASLLNNSSFKYETLTKYLDKLKIKEYEQTIRFHYMIAIIVGLFILLSVFLFMFLFVYRKLKWNRKHAQIALDYLSSIWEKKENLMNLYYEASTKRLVCDPDPDVTEYEFCVAPAGTEDWDCVITPVNYRSVADKSGDQKGKEKSQKNGEWGAYCDPIEFTVS